MAVAGPAHDADNCCGSAATWLRSAGPASFASKLLTISVVFCAMAVAGCARNPAQHELSPAQQEVRVAPARAPARAHGYTEPPRYAGLRVRRPDSGLLARQPAPDCEFKKTNLKVVDPDEWARLKIDYERQCYQAAEKIARDRLGLLQASSTCEMEPDRRRRPAP
jgi:hypothetical protein